MKEVLLALNQQPIAVYPIYIDITGSLTAGVLLSQLLYWDSKMKGNEFYKNDSELMQETRLTQSEFKTAKKMISQLSFMHIERKGTQFRTYYAVDHDELLVVLRRFSSSFTYQLGSRLSTSQRGVNLRTIIGTENTQEITTENTTVVEKGFSTVTLIDEVDETSVEIHHVPEWFEIEGNDEFIPSQTTEKKERKRVAPKKKESADPTPITPMWKEYEKRFADLNQGEPPVFHKKYLRSLKTLSAVLRERTIKKGIVPLNDVQPWCDFLDMAAQHLKNNPKETYLRGRFDPIGIEAEFNKWITTLNNRPKTEAEKWVEWGKRQGL